VMPMPSRPCWSLSVRRKRGPLVATDQLADVFLAVHLAILRRLSSGNGRVAARAAVIGGCSTDQEDSSLQQKALRRGS